ncbi:MAG: ParB N-terminal domain-containing protein [Rickettsiales bacterium]|jgi:ParB-like chromosome segregation protein Spo0J|nr:ParB N-terminal domain-containing protein [Rickettsiales bacterium]
MNKLPPIIEKVGFPFNWEEKEVWELDIPVEQMDINELVWHFDIPFWQTDGGRYDLKPSEVLNNPDKYQHHKERIEKSDISYPLDILNNPKTGRWTLLDGLHRLARLYLLGKTNVSVRKVSVEDIKKTPSYKEL